VCIDDAAPCSSWPPVCWPTNIGLSHGHILAKRQGWEGGTCPCISCSWCVLIEWHAYVSRVVSNLCFFLLHVLYYRSITYTRESCCKFEPFILKLLVVVSVGLIRTSLDCGRPNQRCLNPRDLAAWFTQVCIFGGILLPCLRLPGGIVVGRCFVDTLIQFERPGCCFVSSINAGNRGGCQISQVSTYLAFKAGYIQVVLCVSLNTLSDIP
jgi:hypothetical protein